MLSWGVIAYGAAVSAVVALALVLLVAQERRPLVLALMTAGSFAAPAAWNAVLRAAHGDQFFTDLPVRVFPISWQDIGSGVFTLAALTLVLGLGPLRAEPGRRLAFVAGLGGLAALLVDIYLY